MKRKYKLIMGGIAAAALIVITVMQFAKPLEVKTMQVDRRQIAQTFREEGVVVVAQETSIYTTITGQIISLPVKEGQTVRTGDILAVLDSQPLQFQMEMLEGQLRSLQAQQRTEELAVSLDELRKLYEAGAISQKEYEDAKNKMGSDYYPGQIAALNAQIKALAHQIEQCTVRADRDGVVARLEAKEGMAVAFGTFLLDIQSGEDLQVEVYVLTEDAARLQTGQEVELIQDNKAEDIVFSGRVESIAPAAVEKVSALGLKEQRLKVLIRPEPPQNLQLKPGYALDVSFTVDRQQDRLVVPKTVLFPYENGEGVWVVENGQARVKAVKRGFENDKETAITEGLQSGDKVILNPQLEGLKEGVRVQEK